MPNTTTIQVELTEVEPVKSILAELASLIDQSDGVTGLTVNGESMPWDKVVELYMPTLARRLVRRG